ncbi:hypothetical protein GQF03_02105 [Sneathiella chungangensis]|uniref:Uncharacterized protein n=1 Tax=Sneathiella chungangensis TaxID=1418234 RepID=A0A845MD41_9PROT|nr:hypothetical protein [Sneathiella chungangensis]MZR21117.1 hypothetical protein [Sneathiella chungangensis]
MEDITKINSDISDVMKDISDYLEQTRKGLMIDMSSLPEKIVRIQGKVQSAPRNERLELTNFMNQVMQSLTMLSNEIQQRHDSLGRDIDTLEGRVYKE